MAINIERLCPDNVKLLDKLAPDVFDHDIQQPYLRAFIDDPRHVMFLALDSPSVVGMVSAVEYFHPDKRPQLWINEVGVASTHRRQGIGRRLVDAVVRVARERGCAYVWLGTAAENLPAQACFGSVPDVEDPQPFLLYEWDLKD